LDDLDGWKTAWGRDDLDDSDGWRDVRGRRSDVRGQESEVGEKKGKWPRFHSTFDVIAAIEAGRFPDKVMMTVHPQRWDDRPWPWVRELVAQNVKNIIKGWMIRMNAFGRDD
jgi:hypothetical protein